MGIVCLPSGMLKQTRLMDAAKSYRHKAGDPVIGASAFLVLRQALDEGRVGKGGDWDAAGV